MASHSTAEGSFPEGAPLINNMLFTVDASTLHNIVQSSVSSNLLAPATISPTNALLTSFPTAAAALELRQNNPQDCQNLIIASVDRATVEISRTIIRLNATFSQQLQQASINMTNGINSAKNSATSTISIVVASASSATSSAFFSVTLANRQVSSANLALATAQLDASNVSSASRSVFSASSSDVSRLSSSLALLQASIASLQAVSVVTTGPSGSPQIISVTPSTGRQASVTLTAGQAGAIIAGTIAFSLLLSFVLYLLVLRAQKKKERDSYLDEKDPRSREIPTRSSSTPRTGNEMILKFNPPEIPRTARRSAPRRPKDFPIAASDSGPNYFKSSDTPIKTIPSEKRPKRARNLIATSPPPKPASFERTPPPVPVLNPFVDPREETVSVKSIEDTAARHTIRVPIEELMEILNTEDPRYSGPRTNALKKSISVGDVESLQDPFESPMDDSSEIIVYNEDVHKAEFMELYEEHSSKVWNRDIHDHLQNDRPFSPSENNVPPKEQDQESSLTITREKSTSMLVNEASKEKTALISNMNVLAVDSSLITSTKPVLDDQILGQALPGKQSRVPIPPILPLLDEDENDRSSKMPEIDKVLRMVAEQNGVGDEPLFWSDFRAPDPEVERAVSMVVQRQTSAKKDSLPEQKPPTVVSIKRREEMSETFSPTPTFDDSAAAEPKHIPDPDPLTEQQELQPASSPLRTSISRIPATIILKDDDVSDSRTATSSKSTYEREDRGRSMLRTSDIVEARLSKILRDNSLKEPVAYKASDRADSPLRRNPVDSSPPDPSAYQDFERADSPLRRNPVTSSPASHNLSEKTAFPLRHHPTGLVTPPRRLSPPGVVPLRPIPLPTTRDRTQSPLRRHPIRPSSPPPLPESRLPPRSSSTSSMLRQPSTVSFTDTLSKFQTLEAKNPYDSIRASNTVTERAIAGIFIPSSLREQAVRNLSRSRSRGPALTRGAELSSASQPRLT